jgi:flagellar hook-associated protein 1
MSLNDILNTSRDALAAQQYGLGIAGQNVANVNTPGYARRSALIETQGFAGQSVGTVHVAGLSQAIDQYTERRYFATSALASGASQRNADLAHVEALFNDAQGTGVADALAALFGSFSALSTNPTDKTIRATVLQRAGDFTNRVSTTADALAQFQLDQLDKAKTVASQIDTQASAIADLNGRIAAASVQGQDAADLIDKRTQAITALSELVDVHAIAGENGQVIIQSTGTTLVEGTNARTLSIGVAGNGTMQVLASRIGGGPPSDVSAFLTGGKLGGIRDARDVDAASLITKLDQLAYDVATAINTQHAAGYGLDGNTGRNLFSVSATPTGAARSLTLDATTAGNSDFLAASASPASLPGDTTNAVALAKLADARIATGNTRTATEAYGDLVGEVGIRKQNASLDADTRDSMKAQITQMRETASGVNLDEEMVSLTKFQNAYQAASKVLTTADQLLAELMASVGR